MKRSLATAMLLGFGLLCTDVIAAPPITDGVVLHLDASNITGLSTGAMVATWADSSGMGNNAVSGVDVVDDPLFITDALNGLPVVRFGANNCYFTFPEITDIRTVFWVLKEDFSATINRFFLGHSSSWNFHRGHYKYWDGYWASEYVRNGTTRENGTIIDGTTREFPSEEYVIVSLVTTGNVQANQLTRDRSNTAASWQGDIAEIIIYDRALSDTEENQVGYYLSEKYNINTTYSSVTPPYATSPFPADEETGITESGLILSWSVEDANAPVYDVWFGPEGSMTKRASQQAAATYSIPETLNQDQVYQWRIDVVDGGVTYLGDVTWSFRTILSATKVLEWNLESTSGSGSGHQEFASDVSVTASSDEWGVASDTIDHYGLYGMKHIVYPYDYSWITSLNGGDAPHPVNGSTTGWSAWIAYEFDDVHSLGNMYIWNHNQIFAGTDFTVRGLRNVTIEYSVDGSNWATLSNYEIPKGTGLSDMPASKIIDFGGVSAKYVVITAASTNGNWGYDPGTSNRYYALAKVRFGLAGTSATDTLTPDTADYGSLMGDGKLRGDPLLTQGLNQANNCLAFDGQGDAVVSSQLLGADFPAGGDEQWSMNVYVYLNEKPRAYDIVAGIGCPAAVPDGTLRYIINGNFGYLDQISFWGQNADVHTGVPFDIAKWQMITVTYDGGNLAIYKNGSLLTSQDVLLQDAIPAVHMGDCVSWSLDHGYIDGKIDNFTVYKGVLSSAEIAALADALPLLANFDGNGQVDIDDLRSLIAEWMDDTRITAYPTEDCEDYTPSSDPNILGPWSVVTSDPGTSTLALIEGDANNPLDPEQPRAGSKALRWTYDISGGTAVWGASIRLDWGATVDITQWDGLMVPLKRHTGNSREDYLYVRGLTENGVILFTYWDSANSTDIPPNEWEDKFLWINVTAPFARDVRYLVLGVYSNVSDGGSGVIDVDEIALVDFDICLGEISGVDLNSDCIINLEDFFLLSENWLLSE